MTITSLSTTPYGQAAPAGFQSGRAVAAGTRPSRSPVMPSTHHAGTFIANGCPNLVSFTSPSGGIGLSTITALVALTLSTQNVGCALLDADLPHGGLGILLGIEHEPGLSLQDIDAPLGTIDGKALDLELPHWEDIGVLACASWRGPMPEWWQMQAAMHALCEANQVVLADVGDGTVWEYVPELLLAQHVIAVELSVLGLARAKEHLARLQRLQREFQEDGGEHAAPIIILTEPRGAPKRSTSSAIATTEAIAYLGGDALGPIQHVPRLCGDILDGLGIGAVPRCNRLAVQALADRIMEPLDGKR